VPGAKAFHFNASPEPDNARRKSIIEDDLRKVGCSLGPCLSRGLQWTDDLDADAHRDNESISLCARIRNSLRLWNLKATHRAAGKVKPAYAKNTKWLLFNPNQLRKFHQ
jgi:hypothetical protein